MVAAPVFCLVLISFSAALTTRHAHTDVTVPLQALHLLQLGRTCGVPLGTAAGWHECGCSGRSLLPTSPMSRALLFPQVSSLHDFRGPNNRAGSAPAGGVGCHRPLAARVRAQALAAPMLPGCHADRSYSSRAGEGGGLCHGERPRRFVPQLRPPSCARRPCFISPPQLPPTDQIFGDMHLISTINIIIVFIISGGRRRGGQPPPVACTTGAACHGPRSQPMTRSPLRAPTHPARPGAEDRGPQAGGHALAGHCVWLPCHPGCHTLPGLCAARAAAHAT